MGEYFESMDPFVHARCAQLCAECPVFDWCHKEAQQLVARGMLVSGTWAGRLYGLRPPSNRPECGGHSGPYHHKRAGEESCDACLEFKRSYERSRKRSNRAASR
jgi:hypothetical protein